MWGPKPKIVRTVDYNCAFVLIMAVLIIFPVILQTVINLIMLSIVGQRDSCAYDTRGNLHHL